MKRIVVLLLPVIVFANAALKAQDLKNDSIFIKAIANNILSTSAIYDNLRYLTKNIGGRLAGSPQMVQAEIWGEKAMKEAGAETVVLQECMVPHWVRGGTDKATVVFRNAAGKKETIPLEVLAIGNSLGTGKKGIQAPLIRINSFKELDEQKDRIKGNIVFYNCPFDDTLLRTFEAYGKNVVYRAYGASRAGGYGALAVIIRSMTNGTDNHAHTGALQYIDSLPKIPAAAIGLRDVEKLDALFDQQVSIEAQLITNGHYLPDTIGHNVIGELKGTEFPEEIITVGGHLDSWDVNEGAHDDGAGVVQTIEVLRAFTTLGFKPKHTIRFVLFANEENGTKGAKQYAEEAVKNKEQHIFALESDAGGFTPRGFGLSIKPESWPKVNSWKILFEPYFGNIFTEGGGGSDIGPLNNAFGTPTAGLIPDSQRYFDVHHAVSDVLENVNARELKLGAVNMAALLYLVDKYGL